jgi:arylsulfatase A-like enzyme
LKAQLVDITPTILTWFGLPVPGHVEGQPLPCLPEPRMTRQDSPAPAVPGPHQPQFEYTAEEQAIIEKRLEELGYLE